MVNHLVQTFALFTYFHSSEYNNVCISQNALFKSFIEYEDVRENSDETAKFVFLFNILECKFNG